VCGYQNDFASFFVLLLLALSFVTGAVIKVSWFFDDRLRSSNEQRDIEYTQSNESNGRCAIPAERSVFVRVYVALVPVSTPSLREAKRKIEAVRRWNQDSAKKSRITKKDGIDSDDKRG